MSQVKPESDISQYDMTLTVSETQQGLSVEWEYSTDLFDDCTIERMATNFQQLLAGTENGKKIDSRVLPEALVFIGDQAGKKGGITL